MARTVTWAEAAAELGTSVDTVRRRVEAGQLSTVYVGKRRRVVIEDELAQAAALVSGRRRQGGEAMKEDSGPDGIPHAFRSAVPDTLVDELRSRISYLERMVDAEKAEKAALLELAGRLARKAGEP